MTDHDWDNPITCESVGAQPPEHPNGESTVSSTAIPEKLIRAVTDAYLMALRQGDLHAALGLMTQLANTYGLNFPREAGHSMLTPRGRVLARVAA
ncbi:hypothetical protein ACKI1I_43230 [Streptomyces turgidiscabies]|uniref:hypothetical protein n=1 Tax=Streptomyces TaxID=1883 RepID=UPI002FF29C1F